MQILNRCLSRIVPVIKKHETCKNVNKHVPSGYLINVISNHNKTSKQSYYRGEDAVSAFSKEIRKIADRHIDIYRRPMIDLTECEIYKYENVKYCHICKKVFGEAKKY